MSQSLDSAPQDATPLPRLSLPVVTTLVSVKILLHTSSLFSYGYFRDEFYYLACSEHLAFGYVDQPPLSILLLKISRLALGDSLTAIRILPALSGALTVFLAGLMAGELDTR